MHVNLEVETYGPRASFTYILDRASVRGLALPLPQDGIRGFGRPISLRVIHSRECSQGAVGLADPIVQVAVVRSGAEAAAYAAAIFGFSTPVSNSLPETHMRCMITASLRATATRARFAPGVRHRTGRIARLAAYAVDFAFEILTANPDASQTPAVVPAKITRSNINSLRATMRPQINWDR
jgi:hypothetical protein